MKFPPDANQPSSPAWNEALLANPHGVSDKRQRVQRMFAAIASSYDLNNRLHSLGMDQLWRRRAVKLAEVQATDGVVDVACGTGDLTLKFAAAMERAAATCLVPPTAAVSSSSPSSADRRSPFSPSPGTPGEGRGEGSLRLSPGQVIGIDFTYPMLPLARQKAQRQTPVPITWINGDAQALPLPDASVDVVSIAFGIRNVADPAAAIREFRRVLRPGGRLIILEFSLPANALLRALYNFYFRKVLPRTATLISRDRTGAYKYLPESVNTFIGRQQMMDMMRQAGFANVQQHPLTWGVCVAYRGICGR